MRCASCLALMISTITSNPVGAAQVHLPSPIQTESGFSSEGISGWELERLPDSNSTSNYIFDSVASLLQHWTNTRYSNGHVIVPGIVPTGTLLYHGREDNIFPSEHAEWVATDPEQSYLHSRSWHLTLVATRPLNILYFDGSSAAKMVGPMDTQDLLIWEKPSPPRDEIKRIIDLCNWGKKYALDGFVRMQMDFEIMLCDLTAGLETVSFLNLTDHNPNNWPRLPKEPVVYGKGANSTKETDPDMTAYLPSRGPRIPEWFEVVHSASWHNSYPGEARVKLDLTRFLSFYDITLAPSLVPLRKDQERWQHRVYGISNVDLNAARSRVANILTRSGDWENGSSVDWQTLVRVIVDRYGERLEVLDYVLNAEEGSLGDLSDRASKAFTQLQIMLTPYLLASATPSNSSPGSPELSSTTWASPVFRLCATAHTSYIASSMKLTLSERVILGSIQDTTKEICRVLVGMWVRGVQAEAGLDKGASKIGPDQVDNLMVNWKADLKGLMTWLDWSMWARCKPPCSFEEICYMPMWPFFDGKQRLPMFNPDEGNASKPEPMRIRRLEPYIF